MEITNYKCPNCMAPLHFGETSGKLECDYCGSSFDVAEMEALYANQEQEAEETIEETEEETSSADDEWGEEAKGMKVYSCPSCGAQLFCDETTAATSCPYCGNSAIIQGQFQSSKRPKYLIPFKVDKKKAVETLKEHYKGKLFLPSSFTEKNHIEEIKGIYVPFWMFDAEADTEATFAATRSRTYKRGDYRITDTSHYEVFRSGLVEFQKVPVDASSKMPDDYMDSIEPFNYKKMKEFSTAYLPGFLADQYDVTSQEAFNRADVRCQKSALDAIRSTVRGYETVTLIQKNINLKQKDTQYALFPVWLLSTKWNNKNYLFAMNGQTGKMVGDLPVDKTKLTLWFLGIFLGFSTLLSIFFSGPLGNWIDKLIH